MKQLLVGGEKRSFDAREEMVKRLVAMIIGLLVICLIGCRNQLAPEDGEDDDNDSTRAQAQRVSFEPQGGTYGEDISVELTTDTEAATIRYTTDGRDPVGEKAANQLDIYDMSGNVWEWTWDWDADYPGEPKTDYRGPGNPGSPSFRVLRGGSWFSDSDALQVGRRSSLLPSFTSGYYGFRLVRSR